MKPKRKIKYRIRKNPYPDEVLWNMGYRVRLLCHIKILGLYITEYVEHKKP